MVAALLLPACGKAASTGPDAPTRNAAVSRSSNATNTGGPIRASALCGSRGTAKPPARYQHVIWIWMENHSYSQIIGQSGSAVYANSPYVNGTVVTQCGLATNYHNITHPSLPNYLASVAGTTGGVTTDCSPTRCPQSVASIFSQLDSAGRSWRGYAEDMPSNCSRTNTTTYAARHNPAVYYTGIKAGCSSSDVPMGTTTSGALHDALATDTLPAFSFVTPNLCHDTHDCSTAIGDSWLAGWLPLITGSSAYNAGNTAVFVVWDEGETGSNRSCATNTTDAGCRVAALVLSPYTRAGTRSSTLYNHYGLLRTTETLLGLPHLAHAADATTAAMRSGFHI